MAPFFWAAGMFLPRGYGLATQRYLQQAAQIARRTNWQAHLYSIFRKVVPEGGFEPPTRGFSIRCSTPELLGP
jgi:hypothetical protein